MKRSEKELRRIAGHISPLLPEDQDDARHACELALQLKQWEDQGNEPGKPVLSVLRRER